ncbi:uncharacterized protein LOC115810833 [Chanos chanos]|uniref:Uncharacterized protein LOC115810833 n=1 Tax=Chanos chanos TaxID=29144 RepID=A0A6J2VC36_CHACN|nr:uncharacterized protein LOC115810833 [Chanos chanos]
MASKFRYNQDEDRDKIIPTPRRQKTLKYFSKICGNTLNSHEGFKRQLHEKIQYLTEVSSMEECDFILAFCPVVSRAGTDIEAALGRIPDSKPAILVVLHHTSNPEAIVPDSNRCVGKETLLTVVDCLFYEDYGLLTCEKNTEAVHLCVLQLCEEYNITSTEQVKREQTSTYGIQRHQQDTKRWFLFVAFVIIVLALVCFLGWFIYKRLH